MIFPNECALELLRFPYAIILYSAARTSVVLEGILYLDLSTLFIDGQWTRRHNRILGNSLLLVYIGIGDELEDPCRLYYLNPRAYDVLIRVFLVLPRLEACLDLLLVSTSQTG